MKSERDQEIVDNLPLVTFILKKYFYDITEDMFQTGCIGLIRAVDTYDPTKGILKGTYYAKCIFNEIGGVVRKNKTQIRGGNIETYSLSNEIHDGIYLEDLIESNDNIEDDFVNKDTIEHVFELLDEDEQIIIKYSYGLFDCEQKTQSEIAKILNTNQATISRKLKRTLEKMKGMIENGE